MGWKNREIEVKALVEGVTSMNQLDALVLPFMTETYPEHEILIGKSFDLYWHPPKGSIADFVRLRRTSDDRAQITLKAQDKGDNVNRVEIDLEVHDYKQALALLKVLFGEPEKLSKKYIVYFLEDEHTTVSLYQVTGDPNLFIETEAKTKTRVKELIRQMMKAFPGLTFYMIDKSLYKMFILKETPNKKPMEEFLKDF